MTRHMLVLGLLVLMGAAAAVVAQDDKAPDIDWVRARELFQRSQRGDKLTEEEQEYLDRAKAERAKRGQPRPGAGEGRQSPALPPPREKTGLVPVNQMSATDTYKGEDGGLYGKGSNVPPEAQMKMAIEASARIQPLDAEGKPSAEGRIVVLSVGMSNTTREFSTFKRTAGGYADRNPRLVVVDGAQGGKTADTWASPQSPVWEVVEQRLKAAGVTAKQVQAVWLKEANPNPASLGEFPKCMEHLRDGLIGDAQQIKAHYPNVQIIYLSSRIYAGYAKGPLNPEPYAYESAFAVRWTIQEQIKGSAALNCDPAKGEVKAPVLLWGPYLWTDGTAGRKSDGLVWTPEDVASDGTHPSASGSQKVADLLLEFFKTDSTAVPWFVASKAKPAQAPAKEPAKEPAGAQR